MLIIYSRVDGSVESITSVGNNITTPELVDSLRTVMPLPESQAEYRLYDPEEISRVKEAVQRGDILRLNLAQDGVPLNIHIEPTDNPTKPDVSPPTIEERLQALEQLELMRLFGGGDV